MSARSHLLVSGLTLGLLSAGILTPQAQATVIGLTPAILNPGDSVTPPPQFNDNLVTGLVTFQYLPFGNGTSPSGMFLNFLSTSDLNPFGAHDLVFGYLIAVGQGTVVSVSLSGFSGFETAVKISDNGLVPSTEVTRSADGDTVSFLFTGIPSGPLPTGTPLNGFTVNPSSTSATLDIYTNAPGFTDPGVTITDANGAQAQFDTLGPSTVPEPTTSLLSLAPLLAIGILISRRHRKAGPPERV